MAVSRHDWEAIGAFHEAGHTLRECQRMFGLSNGALSRAIQRGAIRAQRDVVASKPPGVTQRAVAELWAAGHRQAEIATMLGVSRPTVCHHMRRLGVAAEPRLGRRFDWPEIQRYYDGGHSRIECQQRFGFSNSAWAAAKRRGDVEVRDRAMSLETLLVRGPRRSRFNVKLRLLAAGLKANRCERCGLTEWQGRPVSMALHHVNGDGRDNRLENLLLLCPNCHSQTENFAGRNKWSERPRGNPPAPPLSPPAPARRAGATGSGSGRCSTAAAE